MTLVSITLVLAIFLFIAAPVLVNWAMGYLDSRSMYDIQIFHTTITYMKKAIYHMMIMGLSPNSSWIKALKQFMTALSICICPKRKPFTTA